MLPRETGKASTLKERFPTGKTVMETVRSMAEVEAADVDSAKVDWAEEEYQVVGVRLGQVVSPDNRLDVCMLNCRACEEFMVQCVTGFHFPGTLIEFNWQGHRLWFLDGSCSGRCFEKTGTPSMSDWGSW